MNYTDFDTTTDTDATPWTATMPSYSSQIVPGGRGGPMVAGDANAAPWAATPSGNQLVAAPRGVQMVPANTGAATTSDMVVLGSLIQSLQQTQQRQMNVLRDLDERIGHLENAARPNIQPQQVPSFERTTWWAIWGLLMLILGGALAVLIVLIMMRVTIS